MTASPAFSSLLDRRRLLQWGAASAAAGLLSTQVESARGFAANDTIEVACVGTGGRCRRLMERLGKLPGVRLAAVCDIWDVHRNMGLELADKAALSETDYRKLLDRSDIDAVLIGSPDHWHTPMTVDACDAGKDVYVEKPLTHNLEEGQSVIDAQNRNKRIVQVGTQQRSMPHLIEAREIIRSGELGKIHKIQMSWNRNQERWSRPDYKINPQSVLWKQFLGSAPDQPFDEYRFRNWRWFWDFGGGIFTDLMVHWIDTASWMLDLDAPSVAMSIGDQFASAGLWETPDTVQTLLRYPEQNLQAHFEGTFVNHRNRSMLEFMGTDATLYCDRGRYEVHPQRHKRVTARERVDGVTGVRGADFFEEVDGAVYHLANWTDCIRTRKTPSCPAEQGVRSAAAAHLANQSLRTGQAARFKK
ncbi:Gfo/Idh/MocA family protein [Lignipirellula cremea]|uniref:Inositol 2-dehydrogenase n=1 Tax=Lignipirellula cremea TaxID=2528010 RepID=A0A518DX38_9BACT|nr:Gfo/Idh/MocA family oxidoreductase [Lignipirellula cremea]QDU96411.1 Inositol 2-dehydrogenase [Lignipirellula cremea]